jgi:hypothetical protein
MITLWVIYIHMAEQASRAGAGVSHTIYNCLVAPDIYITV